MTDFESDLGYTGICLWDSCLECPHRYNCEDGIQTLEEEDDEE